MKEVMRILKALSDETRLRIVALLTQGELCVCQIEAVLDLPQSTVSRHLAVLRAADLIQSRREGLWVYYSLSELENPFHVCLVQCLKTALQDHPTFRNDLAQMSAVCCQDKESIRPSRKAV